MPQFRYCLLGVLFFLISSLSSSWAIIYHAGKYTVDIEVRNAIQMIIPDAKVDIWVGSKNISVEARSAGYLSKTVQIPIGQATYYKRIINLQDPTKSFSAEDWSGGTLSSVYFRCDQYGIAPNKFGITVSIPEAVWPNPMLKNVRLYDASWGITFKYEGAIEKSEGFYHVRMVVSRKLLGMTGKQWVILFDTRKPTGEATQQPRQELLSRWLQRLETSERLLGSEIPEEGESLVEVLSAHLNSRDVRALDLPLPASLEARYAFSDRFNALHREND